jgi:hypothetical protein
MASPQTQTHVLGGCGWTQTHVPAEGASHTLRRGGRFPTPPTSPHQQSGAPHPQADNIKNKVGGVGMGFDCYGSNPKITGITKYMIASPTPPATINRIP